MTQHEGRRLRLLRAQRPPVLPHRRPETAETLLPDVPRVGALDALLREVDSLRLSLETDLTLAAAAVESGAVQVAADIIDSERDGLRSFEARALGHVADLAAPRRRRVRVPAAPFVAAAAVAGFLLGVVPHTAAPTQTDTISAQSASASQSLATLEAAASSGQTSEAIAAAKQLHGQIALVLATAQTDPNAAKAALAMLHKEQVALLAAGGDSTALDQVLAVSRQLSSTLLTVLNGSKAPAVRTSQAPAVPVLPSARPQSSTTPKATSSPTKKPTQSPSPKPKTSSSPEPSSSPSGNGLPGTPGFQ